MARLLLLMLLALSSLDAAALVINSGNRTYSYQFIPANPVAGQEVIFRFDVAPSNICYESFLEASADVAARTILVYSFFEDGTYSPPCPAWAQPFRQNSIGALPAGEYAVTYRSCGVVPPGEVPCTDYAFETLVVGAPHAVPAVSLQTLIALFCSLLVVGFERLASHRRRANPRRMAKPPSSSAITIPPRARNAGTDTANTENASLPTNAGGVVSPGTTIEGVA